MNYQFRPYKNFHTIEVELTGKVYEKGEHPIYTKHKIIEVVDKESNIHDAFEDELKSDEVAKQKTLYNEEEVLVLLHKRDKYNWDRSLWQTPKEWFKKFKNK
jgi:hypothetical protein